MNTTNKLKNAIIDILQKKVITLALKKLLGAAVLGGFWGWVISYIAKHLFNEVVIPLVEKAFIEFEFIYDVKEGKKKLKEVRNVKNSNEWRTSVSDI